MQINLPKEIAGTIYPMTAAGLWGSLYIVVDVGTTDFPPVTLTWLRLLIGSTALYTILKLRYKSRELYADDYVKFFFLGIFISTGSITQFIGTDLTNGTQAAILTVLSPIFVVPISVVYTNENFGKGRISGIILSFTGVLMVIGSRYNIYSLQGGTFIGILLLLIGSAAWAAYTVYGNQVVKDYTPLEVVTYSSIISVPITGVISAFEIAIVGLPNVTADLSISIFFISLYLGIFSTAFAYYFWYKGLEVSTAGSVSVYLFMQPLVGAIIGVFVFNEQFNVGILFGAIMMLFGIYIVDLDHGHTD